MKIHFVTGNLGKFTEMKEYLQDTSVELIQTPLELIEPQADDVEGVSRAKAKQAFAQLNLPLIVEDSGLGIDAHYGLPGPYVKQATTWAGAVGFCEMIPEGKPRTCRWTSVITYVDANGNIHSFPDSSETGTIAKEPYEGQLVERAKGELWKVYQPHGFDKPLAAMNTEEWQDFVSRRKPFSPYAKFAEFMRASEK